jgi:hypothetical protein
MTGFWGFAGVVGAGRHLFLVGTIPHVSRRQRLHISFARTRLIAELASSSESRQRKARLGTGRQTERKAGTTASRVLDHDISSLSRGEVAGDG